MSFADCIEDSHARGEITREYADWLLSRWRQTNSARDPVRARTDLERNLAVAGAEKRRRDLLVAKAKDQMLKDVLGYRTPHGAQDMREAMYSMFEGFGHAGYSGLKQLHEAYLGLMHAKMADVLEAFHRTKLTGSRTNQAMMRDVRKASFGEKTTPQAKALYDAFAQAAEWARLKRNEMGGMTPKREDWGLPQSHDELAVARAFGEKDPAKARERWVKFTNDRLDWTKMHDMMTGELFPPNLAEARKLAILGHIHQTISTGGEINNLPKMTPSGRASIATQGAESRFLVFKDAKSASEYNREFGTGDEFSQMMDHLHRMASDIALMHRFGPNPAGMINFMGKMLDLEGAKAQVGETHALGAKVNRDNARSVVQTGKNLLEAFYEQYRGEPASNNWKALAGTVARNVATSALLGSSAIPHAASNWMIQSFARYAGGIPFMKVLPQLLNGFRGSSHAEMLRAGLDVENGLYHVGAGARQLSRFAKVANWSRWLPDRTTHWFGLIPIVDANKNSFNHGMMATIADHQSKPWAELPRFLRDKMQGYGMREPHWRVIQLAQQYAPSVGSAKWVRPNDVEGLGVTRPDAVLHAYGRTSLDPRSDDTKEATKIAEDVGMRMRVYMMGEREIAVPQSSMRGRARIYGKSDAGTWWGQFRRSFGLFKSFIGSFMISQIHTITNLMARNKWSGGAYAAAIAIGMTIGGMLSLQLKQGSAGKDYAPMNPLTKSGFVSWLRAALTGGSFGIFGDFLASDRSSFGVGPLETLAGPVAEWPLSAMQGTTDTVKSMFAGTNREPLSTIIANAGIKFARANTPFLSTGWPVRAAYNRMFLDQLQNLVDRDSHHRQRLQEEHLRNETGQSFAWRPGHVLPDRLPQFTPSR